MFLHKRSIERAAARGIEHRLSLAELKQMYAAAKGQCQVSGIYFNKFRPMGSTKRPWYPSVDRIDSSKPYTADNCRVVCVAVNMAMGEWGIEVLRAIAKAMILGHPGAICTGPEADPYKFPPVAGTLTKRQIQRRQERIRHWRNHEHITNGETVT